MKRYFYNSVTLVILAALVAALALAIRPGRAVLADDTTATPPPTETATPVPTATPTFSIQPSMTYGDIFIINTVEITTIILVVLLLALITLEILYNRHGPTQP
jgi:hypothetical protein